MSQRLTIAASPHLHAPASTERIMWSVVITLLPIVAAAFFFFGLGALLVILAATLGSIATERQFGPGGTLRDGSAAITGILLGLTLPAALPLWMAALGGAFAIGMGKLVFGGLGQNVFNPALFGRAFLQAAFPIAVTTWPQVGQGWSTTYATNFAWPFLKLTDVDVVTAATPLGQMKFGHTTTPIWDLVTGNVGGSLGETSAVLILAGGSYLAWKGFLNWRIPVVILGTAALLSSLLHIVKADYPGPFFTLFSGGLMIGAVYMATDTVTSPITARGCWIFGAGIGFLVVLIRVWGGLPEGVMYAILLMNALVPTINRVTQPRVFGVLRPQEAV